jgi:hypothetical protein
MSLGERIASSGEASAALCAAGAFPAYGLHLGGPGETPEMCNAMYAYVDPRTGRSASTCGEEVRACWREGGVDDYRLRAPYRVAMCISDGLAIANSRGALTTIPANSYTVPELHRGDMFGVDLDKSDGHVGIARSESVVNEDGSISFLSVEGGQGRPGQEETKLREQCWRLGEHGGWYAHALDRPDVVRRVTHIVSAARMESGGPIVDVESSDAPAEG